jgi:hypothetical protein
VYTVTTPITTAQLLLGDYDVTVDATDAGGTVATGADAGNLGVHPLGHTDPHGQPDRHRSCPQSARQLRWHYSSASTPVYLKLP